MSALDRCFWGCGYAWYWVSYYDDAAIISNKNENLNSPRASFLREVTSKMRCRSKVQGKKVSQRWCQHLTDAFGGVGTLGIEWAIMMTLQSSLTKMKTLTAREQAFWEKSQAKWDAGARCRERKWELFVSHDPHSFAAHSHVRLPLNMERLLSVNNISW